MLDDEAVNQVEETVVDQPVEQPVEAKPLEAEPVETPAQLSFKQLREKADRAEREAQRLGRERDEIARKYEEYNSKANPLPQEEEESSIRPDELVEGKHLSRYEKKIKKLEQQLQDHTRKTQAMTAESRIRSEFPDYDKVVTEETLYILRSQFPELASSIAANPDLYSQAKAAHQAIAKLGLAQTDTSLEQTLIAKNTAKPRPLASIAPSQGDSPLTRANAFANGLTDELKAQLYKEAKDAANSR